MSGLIRSAVVASLVLVALVACGLPFGIGGKFALSNAKVDATYTCPNPADNLPYDVHATIHAQNSLSNSVSIKSISETWTNVAVHGNWSGTKGDHGTTDVSDFTPKSVTAGGSASIKFVIPFQCSNAGAGSDTYGDFSFKFVVKTSSGSYTISSDDTHRLSFAS